VERVLAEYETAHEARDLTRLAAVWNMSGALLEETRQIFESSSRLMMWLEIVATDKTGDAIRVDFDQIVDADRALGRRQALSFGHL